MKKYIVFLMAGITIMFSSCKKESSLDDLGQGNGSVKASLRVTLNDRNPIIGSDIIITANTWHINDEIEKVEFFKTVVEKYAVNLELAKTELNSWKTGENPVFLIVDTLTANEAFKTVNKSELNNFFQTVSDAYVVIETYNTFNPLSVEGEDLINSLSDISWNSLKSALSNQIASDDYILLFPTAPTSHVNGPVLTAAGKLNLVNNLTKSILINGGLKSATKVGELVLDLKVSVTAKGNAVSEVNNKLQAKF